MLLHSWFAVGPEITITFQTASGLEPGKTAVKYTDVTVGIVKDIALSGNDDARVQVSIRLNESAASLARADVLGGTPPCRYEWRFWY